MSAVGFEPPRTGQTDWQRVEKIKEIQRGKLNSSTNGTLTLAASASTTTVQDSLCSANSRIYVTPQSQTASEDLCSSQFWITPGDGSFVIHHPNRTETDRTFGYDVIG